VTRLRKHGEITSNPIINETKKYNSGTIAIEKSNAMPKLFSVKPKIATLLLKENNHCLCIFLYIDTKKAEIAAKEEKTIKNTPMCIKILLSESNGTKIRITKMLTAKKVTAIKVFLKCVK